MFFEKYSFVGVKIYRNSLEFQQYDRSQCTSIKAGIQWTSIALSMMAYKDELLYSA